MSQTQTTIEASIAASASKVTAAGSTVTVVSWFNDSNLGMWAGIFIGFTGLMINFYYKHKHDKRAQEAHEAYLHTLKYQHLVTPLKDMGEDE